MELVTVAMDALNFIQPFHFWTMSCAPPGPKTMYRHPQNGRTLPSCFRNPSSQTPSYYFGCVALTKIFRPFYHALHPSSSQDDVLSSANRTHITLQLPEPFHLAMDLPGFETTYRRPLNVLSTCWPVFPTVLQCPASLLAPRRRIVFRKNACTPPSSFRKPSTWPWASQASRRRIAVRSTPSLRVGRVRMLDGIGHG